ncbi:MAG: hypothetical protein AAFP80_13655 [Pseudomonadota bacterium]
MRSSTLTTVGDVLKTVFPRGTQHVASAWSSSESNGDEVPEHQLGIKHWQIIPTLPYDVFAFCAYLIDVTGLIVHFEPSSAVPAATELAKAPAKVRLSKKDRGYCDTSSKKWEKKGRPDLQTHLLWAEIIAGAGDTIRIRDHYRLSHEHFEKNGVHLPVPRWWTAAFKLLRIADEACKGVGHEHEITKEMPVYKRMPILRSKQSRKGILRSPTSQSDVAFVKADKQLSTLAAAADKGIVCVQPKGRVSQVGCSLRNLSRNLSITGPVGSVRCSWQVLSGLPRGGKIDTLNLLLVPIPYALTSASFVPCQHISEDHWGNFSINQKWLDDGQIARENLPGFLEQMIKKALDEVPSINGIVLPEYAIDYALFEALTRIANRASNGKIEFMIAGCSDNCDDEKVNCVVTAIWEKTEKDNSRNRRVKIISQRKHHRWKLNDGQTRYYGISSALAPFKDWWEQHDIDARELNFFQFRDNAVFSSLICEDLARNDPCHDILRSVAPNLIFALLMDGPQIPERWPARYASTLADDPGSTIITLTSRALVERANDYSGFARSNSVGLIRDEDGISHQLDLDQGANGVLVTLASKEVKDVTIDGRWTDNASGWYYQNQMQITVAHSNWTNKSSFKERRLEEPIFKTGQKLKKRRRN